MHRLLLAMLFVGCAACVSENSKTATTTSEADTARRAYVDPETGELVAPPAQTPKSHTQMQAPDIGTTPQPGYTRETRPDGTTMLRPKAPARHVIEAHRDDDGNLTIRERDDHAQ